MIQDIFPHKLDNQFHPDTPASPDDMIFCVKSSQGSILVGEPFENIRFPTRGELPEGLETKYLLRLDGRNIFLCSGNDAESLSAPEGYAWKTLRELRAVHAGPQYMMFTAYTGLQLSSWYRDNAFCGRCAAGTVHSKTERAVVCPACGRTIYPRIIPAVIVGVINGERILLTKYAGRDFAHYALIAGFTEIGETFEETVQREVMEEAGIRVKNIRYYKSQPWGIVDDLLAGFYCDVDGDPTIRMDRNELKEAGWHTRDEIVLQPTDHSLTNEMMARFKQGLKC